MSFLINQYVFVYKQLFTLSVKMYFLFNIKSSKIKDLFIFYLSYQAINKLFNFSINYKNIFNYYTIYIKKYYVCESFKNVLLMHLLNNSNYKRLYMKYYLLTFSQLFYTIELTLSDYTKNNCFLFMNYSLKQQYYLNSAKLWCEYMALKLKKKISLFRLFYYIKKQQQSEKSRCALDIQSNNKTNMSLHAYKYPLKGIRIMYAGNLKKAKRKRKVFYYL